MFLLMKQDLTKKLVALQNAEAEEVVLISATVTVGTIEEKD